MGEGRKDMTLLLWIAVPLMLLGAVMLIAGVGASAIWIALVTVGIALVVIERTIHRQSFGS
jgi:hypothetical protein